VAVVRRPTGGGTVWHEHEVTYAVTAPIRLFGSVRLAYRTVHERIAGALRALGVPVQLAGHGAPARPSEDGGCFSRSAGGELLMRGRKLVGSAQVRQGQAFLQHGSILLDGSQDPVATFRKRSLTPGTRAVTLRETLGRPIAFAEVAAALVRQWKSLESVTLSTVPADISAARARFDSPGWIWRR
jgi:lipoate-protein ligase A